MLVERLLAVWIFCSAVRYGSGNVVREDTNEGIFEYSPPKFRFIGPQMGSILAEVVILDPEDYVSFCSEETNFTDKYGDKIVILPESFVDWTCNGKFGGITEYKYLVKWCSLIGTKIVRAGAWEPGILANENDGDQFRSLLERNPELLGCTIVEGRSDRSQYQAFANSNSSKCGVLARLTVDRNLSLALFDSIGVVLFRIFTGMTFLVMFCRSTKVLFARNQEKKLNLNIGLTLGLVQIVSLLLGVMKVGGTNFLAPFWSVKVMVFFQSDMFGASVAQNFLISALFNQIANFSAKSLSGGIPNTQRLFIFIAFCLFITDVIVSFILSNAQDKTRFERAQTYLPLLLISVQLGITWYQWLQTRKVAKSLSRCIELSPINSKIAEVERVLLKKIIRGVRISIVADGFQTFGFVALLFMFQSRYLLLGLNMMQVIAKSISLYAQIEICKPVEAGKVSPLVTSLKPPSIVTVGTLLSREVTASIPSEGMAKDD